MDGDNEIALTPVDEAVLKGETPPETTEAVETAVAAPEKAQETPPEVKTAEEPEEKLVPLQALREARASNKELKLNQQRLEERFADLQRMFGPKPAETKPPPDWDADPLNAGKHDRETAQQRDERLAKLEQRFQAEENNKQLAAVVSQHVAEFQKATPDYLQAYAHLKNNRFAELTLMGATQEQALQMIGQEEQNFARAALQQGKNPAELVYAIAQQRGYRKAEAAPEKGATAAIAAINRGQAAAPSVAQAGGSPSEGLSLERVANMSMDDIAAIDDKTWRKLFA